MAGSYLTIVDARASCTGVAKSLHWLVLALLVVLFAIAWTMPEIGRGSVPSGLIGWHLSVGVAILAVMIVRDHAAFAIVRKVEAVDSTAKPPRTRNRR